MKSKKIWKNWLLSQKKKVSKWKETKRNLIVIVYLSCCVGETLLIALLLESGIQNNTIGGGVLIIWPFYSKKAISILFQSNG